MLSFAGSLFNHICMLDKCMERNKVKNSNKQMRSKVILVTCLYYEPFWKLQIVGKEEFNKKKKTNIFQF